MIGTKPKAVLQIQCKTPYDFGNHWPTLTTSCHGLSHLRLRACHRSWHEGCRCVLGMHVIGYLGHDACLQSITTRNHDICCACRCVHMTMSYHRAQILPAQNRLVETRGSCRVCWRPRVRPQAYSGGRNMETAGSLC